MTLRRAMAVRSVLLELVLVGVGVVLRLVVSARGHNYDVDSYLIVDDIQSHGGNVYADTPRYNYGPAWFLVLRVIGVLSGHDHATFRLLLVMFLIGVDLAIWWFLRRRFGRIPALLFFLSPVQIIICGYHNQFDSLAVLVGLLAVAQLDRPNVTTRRLILGASLLGASLVVKHLLFALPLWLALHQKTLRRRLLVLALPVVLFAASFAPFLARGGARGVVDHVLLYSSFKNDPLWHVLSFGGLPVALATPLFLAVLVGCGVLLRRSCPTEMLLAYLLVLVAFSPSMTNQYLAIVSVPIAVWWRPIFGAFTGLGAFFLLAHGDGLHLSRLHSMPTVLGGGGSSLRSYDLLILPLFLGTVLQVVRLRRNTFGEAVTSCTRCRFPGVTQPARVLPAAEGVSITAL